MQSANLSGPFRGCLYYALLGLPQATGLAGGYDSPILKKRQETVCQQKAKSARKRRSGGDNSGVKSL